MTAAILTDLDRKLAKLAPAQRAYLKRQMQWLETARVEQLPPSPSDQAAWLARMEIERPGKVIITDPEEPWDECGIQAGRGFGKLVDRETPLPTPNGWRKIKDLAVGDEIFDETGAPCRVLKTFDAMPRKAYRLTFSDGTTIDACDEHQWATWTHRDRKQYLRNNAPVDDFPANWPAYRQPLYHAKSGIVGYCGPEVRTTQQIVDTFTHGSRKDTNHCIPVCGDLQYPERDLPLDPWLLGYWLGNGATTDVRISCHQDDTPLVMPLFAEAQFVCFPVRNCERDFRAKGLATHLRALLVFGDKHVPRAYHESSPEQRRALLAGLLDSDGYCDPTTGVVEFCSTARALADDVVELARGLGQKPVLAEGRAKLYDRDCGPKFRVTWRPTYQPFRLPRKAAAWRNPGSQALRNKHRMIVSFEEIAPKPMRCLTVDSPHSLFLIGESMIPTHNTRTGSEWLAREAWEDPECLPCCVIAPTQNDVRRTCFEGVSGLLKTVPPECVKDYTSTDLILTLTNGVEIRGFSAEKGERLRGPEHRAGWLDELAGWGPDGENTFDMFTFGLRLGKHPRFIWTSTPKPIPLVRRLLTPQPGRLIIRGSTYDNAANLADKFLKKVTVHEGTRMGRQELHGEMINPEEAGIVRRSQFRLWPAAHPLPKFTWIIMSLDTAFTEKTLDKKGDPDPSACGVFGVFEYEKRSNVMLLDCWEDHLGLPDLVRRVRKEMSYSYGDDDDRAMIQPLFGSSKPRGSGRKPDVLLIEDKGSGISLRQTLSEMGLDAHPFNPGRADKLARLHVVSPLFAQKRVWVPESADPALAKKPRKWAEPLIDQLCTFAGDGSLKHDDFVDVATQALRFCMNNNLLEFSAEPQHKRREREEDDFFAKSAQQASSIGNPYDQ